jgi:hypothetical protein
MKLINTELLLTTVYTTYQDEQGNLFVYGDGDLTRTNIFGVETHYGTSSPYILD